MIFSHLYSFPLLASLYVQNISANKDFDTSKLFCQKISKPEDSVIFSSQLVIHPVQVLVCDQPGLGYDIVLMAKVDTILSNEQFLR